MAIKVTVALCLAFAIVAQAQKSITNDLAAKENSLNCLLGKPSCVSPSPPPSVSPPPPGSPPPTTPPPATPPPVEGPPPAVSPPTPAPEEVPVPAPVEAPVPAPVEAPVPAPAEVPVPAPAEVPVPAPAILPPAPAPAPTFTAVVVISISLPAGVVLTDAQRAQLAADVASFLPGTTVELQVSGGRKLLDISTLTLVISGIKDCASAFSTLDTDIPTELPQLAQSQGIPLQTATLNAFACSDGSPPFQGSPAVAPGPAPLG